MVIKRYPVEYRTPDVEKKRIEEESQFEYIIDFYQWYTTQIKIVNGHQYLYKLQLKCVKKTIHWLLIFNDYDIWKWVRFEVEFYTWEFYF